MSVLGDLRLRDKWLPVDPLLDYLNDKLQLDEDTKLEQTAFMRKVNKSFPDMSSSGMQVTIDGNVKVRLFRHLYTTKQGSRQHFFYVTTKEAAPMGPKALNAASWASDFAAQHMPPITRQHVETILDAPPKKKLRLAESDCSSNTIREMQEPAIAISYWDSGDARKLFAPRGKYGDKVAVLPIVMARIELLESVNQFSSYWRLVLDGGDPNKTCTEHDVHAIQLRCLCLAKICG
jgi:hypothetical protein